jgi:hypothetical protein
MHKITNFVVLYISLFIIEIVNSFLIVLLYFIVDSLDFKGSFDSAILWNFWRVLFYGIPFIILYFLLFKYVGNIKLYKPLLFSFFNLLIYIGLSVLSRVIWGKNVPLSMDVMMFWVTCISIILSPLLLGQIPYFKKLMYNL